MQASPWGRGQRKAHPLAHPLSWLRRPVSSVKAIIVFIFDEATKSPATIRQTCHWENYDRLFQRMTTSVRVGRRQASPKVSKLRSSGWMPTEPLICKRIWGSNKLPDLPESESVRGWFCLVIKRTQHM